MLALTRKTEYALIAVCHMARVGDRIVSARDIADAYKVPLPLLMNVLKSLNHCGLVRSVRGARGGYSLAVPPERLSLATLLEAVEGPLRLVRCVPSNGESDESCELIGSCPIRYPVHKLHDKLRAFLDNFSVAELAFDDWDGDARHPYKALSVLVQ